MPLVFSAHAGSLLALTGSPVNVLVSEAAQDAAIAASASSSLALVGLPLLIGTMAIIVLFGEKRCCRSATALDAGRLQPPCADACRTIWPVGRRVPAARQGHPAAGRYAA
ncbi:MAG: hypothetical protein U1E16_01495 [Hyphomicrobiales bacterium]